MLLKVDAIKHFPIIYDFFDITLFTFTGNCFQSINT